MDNQETITRNCEACKMQPPCILRYRRVSLGEKTYCSNGTTHLIDEASLA